MTGLVQIHNEWDPLEEVIVGRAEYAQIARRDRSLHAVEYPELDSPDNIPSGRYPQRVIEETIEDLEEFVTALQKMGITVRRPEITDHSLPFRTPDWESDGQYNYCPRDLFVTVGNSIIEAPMTLRARQYETNSFKDILLEYLRSGSRWISAPRPRLRDDMYDLAPNRAIAVGEYEPVFDAANILRVGRDIFYLVSDTGNKIGALWLQQALGDEYRVHAYEGVYSGSHIDTTITLLRPGLVLMNPTRVNHSNLPGMFKNWDVLYVPDVVDIGSTGRAYASPWIGMNFIMINPSLAVVDKNQTPIIKLLEKHEIDVLPLSLRHSRTMGGGFHCVTVDIRRKGTLESYCD